MLGHRLLCLLLVSGAMAVPASATDVLLFAAASLKPALEEISALPEAKAIGEINASYAASSALARQIEAGAPADIFISADQEWMDWLAERGKIVAATRFELVRNELVLVAPQASRLQFTLDDKTDLRAALGDSRIALAEPGSVPAGKYAKAALEKLGLWTHVQDKYVAAENVRAALALAARGEVPLAAVYRSDAVSETSVRVISTFPADSHPPIVYPAAAPAGHDNATTRQLLQLLRSDQAQAILLRWGFRTAKAD
ncbi:molybdate transport system substrate-binding protein [Tahibacter aquaticus]|uniref:Molybdate transport system substrate-binding protein n=1 Tax=Tahibacter aquaticus TaxID=520092 RepID=A0A4V3DNI2_9GAMM|nr:molybdate ABC transporter substrate-binding protein [Tahibacter aquaticus]TDR48496.1 molybdate transport system substrate-binding protein [Tahibacter aquaticus]